MVWKKYRVESGRSFKLKSFDPDDTDGFESKEKAEKRLHDGLRELCRMQEVLYAHDRYALLLIFVVAAVITPTGDMATQTIFAAPMVGLYLLSIVIAWIVGRKPQERKQA